MTGNTDSLAPVELGFDEPAVRDRPRLVTLGLALALLVLAAFKPAGRFDPHAMGSPSLLFSTLVLLPLVGNAIYTVAVDLTAGHSRADLPVAATLAALATLLHGLYDVEALFLFGAYFIFAMIYLAWYRTDRTMGFWVGVILHAAMNAPGAIGAFLGLVQMPSWPV